LLQGVSAMKDYSAAEVSVGAFVAAGILALVYLSLSIGGLRTTRPAHYAITARFASVGDLGEGAPVKLAGVPVGSVTRITLRDYTAETQLEIRASVTLPADTIASVRSNGLLGGQYVSLSPGAAAENVKPGGRILQTEPAVDLVEMMANYAFGSPLQKGRTASGDHDAGTQGPFSNPLE
jgi:phospholipid/cholesterol/gamma-HCH transport system substrate-binding protein